MDVCTFLSNLCIYPCIPQPTQDALLRDRKRRKKHSTPVGIEPMTSRVLLCWCVLYHCATTVALGAYLYLDHPDFHHFQELSFLWKSILIFRFISLLSLIHQEALNLFQSEHQRYRWYLKILEQEAQLKLFLRKAERKPEFRSDLNSGPFSNSHP